MVGGNVSYGDRRRARRQQRHDASITKRSRVALPQRRVRIVSQRLSLDTALQPARETAGRNFGEKDKKKWRRRRGKETAWPGDWRQVCIIHARGHASVSAAF